MAKTSKKAAPKVCRCKVCGRVLKSPESIARGIGPTCEQKVLGVVRGASLGKPKAKRHGEWSQKWLFDDIRPEGNQ